MSLFISKKTFNHEYLNLLKKRNYNVYLMEVPNTSKCKLRSATNCTIMLHNIKFEYLYNELRKP